MFSDATTVKFHRGQRRDRAGAVWAGYPESSVLHGMLEFEAVCRSAAQRHVITRNLPYPMELRVGCVPVAGYRGGEVAVRQQACRGTPLRPPRQAFCPHQLVTLHVDHLQGGLQALPCVLAQRLPSPWRAVSLSQSALPSRFVRLCRVRQGNPGVHKHLCCT